MRYVLISLLLLFGICSICFNAATFAREEEKQPPTRSSRSQPSLSTKSANLDTQLDQILENQQKILTRIQEALEEARIVKIRASQ